MPPVARLWIACLLAASALAIGATIPPALAGHVYAQGVATSVDPVAVQAQIEADRDFNVAALWQTLKIPAQLDTVYSKVNVAPPDSAKTPFDRCMNSCLAELTRANVDDDPGAEVILTIYQEGRLCRFLVFKSITTSSGALQWRFIGYADHDALGQYEPESRVSFMGGRRYFVVSAPTQRGTGSSLRYERWYEVTPAGMHEILSLPAEGVDCANARALCRAFGATVVGSRIGPRGEELLVGFTSRYWGDEFMLDESRSGEVALFGRNQRAVYVRPLKSAERYTLAPLDSEIATWEVDAVFRPESVSCQDFLVVNADPLQQMASTGAAAARAWLTRFVSGCDASAQRTELLERLSK